MNEVDILLVEDNRADAVFVQEAFKKSQLKITIHTVEDGDDALAYLTRQGDFHAASSPDMILLDLNLPRMDGQAVLQQIKNDPDLRRIPVLVFTSSAAPGDIRKCYDNHANAYLIKPVGLKNMMETVNRIEDFWFSLAKLPSGQSAA